MFYFDGSVEGRDALQDYLTDRKEALPDDVRERLYAATKERSPVVGCRIAAELVYARKGDLPAGVKDLAAGIATMMAANGFFDFDREGRGARIAGALRREADTVPSGITPQAEDLDPEPAREFVPEPAAEAPAAAEAGG